MSATPVAFCAPLHTSIPTGDDGAGRPITMTGDGVTRWEPLTAPKETNSGR